MTMPRGLGERIVTTLCTVIAIWIIWCGVLFMAQNMVIFPRGLTTDRVLDTAPDDVDVWTLDIDDEQPVEAWFLEASGSTPAPAVVIMHANAELIDDLLDSARALRDRGVHVLLPEYRGYGRSGGRPSQDAIVSDTSAFIDRLHGRDDVGAVAYIGRSIGTGVAAQVARAHPPAAMVLMMPPARIDTFGWRFGFPQQFVTSPFRTDLAVPEIDAPILIIARSRDEVIPASHPALLHDLARDSTLVTIEGTHNVMDSEDQANRQRAAIRDFLLEALAISQAR